VASVVRTNTRPIRAPAPAAPKAAESVTGSASNASHTGGKRRGPIRERGEPLTW
jgi:hypothetical protein